MKRLQPALSPRFCLRCLVCASIALIPLAAHAQQRDSIMAIQRAFEQLITASRVAAVFPGFRPDTLPYAFVLRNRGVLLLNWRGVLPKGFEAIADLPYGGWQSTTALGAASTNTELDGRAVAQIVVDKLDTRELAALAAHEAFHVFETAVRSARSYIGERENSFMVSSYPVFDTINEASMALEGRLLERALRSGSVEQARQIARQYAAVRDVRHRRLGHSLAEFEQKAEANEGLAEYALLRTGNALDGVAPAHAPESLLRDLRRLTADPTRSIRLRYYLTGSAQALLLDRLDPQWKNTFLNERVFLDELVARASGARAEELQSGRTAEQQEDFVAMTKAAAGQLSSLRSRRRAQIDSILARPGLQLVIDLSALPNRDIGWCGIDPQNLLQASPRVLIHTRWLRACSGRAVDAELSTPSIQDRDAATLTAVIEPEIAITAMGQPIQLENGKTIELKDVIVESRTFNARFERAEFNRDGNRLRITPRI